VFGTVHAPLIHPIVAAKQCATVDLISEGRFGLNMVAGWNSDEFSMFGTKQLEHDTRYEYAREWVEIIRELWTREGEFDYHGAFFDLEKLYAEPKPYGGSRPAIMNAGASPAARVRDPDLRLALHAARFHRTSAKTVAEVRAQAAAAGRHVDVYTSTYCVAGRRVPKPRPTITTTSRSAATGKRSIT